MQVLNIVICNSGDGSNHLKWVTDYNVIDKMEIEVDDGNETYSSGDGLQVYTLSFPDGFDLDNFIKINHISITTLEDFE